jgi:hypothetical protein
MQLQAGGLFGREVQPTTEQPVAGLPFVVDLLELDRQAVQGFTADQQFAVWLHRKLLK